MFISTRITLAIKGEHEWFLNTNIFLNTNNTNFTNLNCYAIFSIKNYSCYSCYSCSKNNILRVQKYYYPCSKIIIRVQNSEIDNSKCAKRTIQNSRIKIQKSFYHPCRIAYSKRIVRNVLDHYASCTYHTPVANFYARTHNNSSAQPAVATNGYGETGLDRFSALQIVDRMVRRDQPAVGSQLCVRPDGYRSAVEHRAPSVYEHVLANFHAMAMVTIKRRTYHRRGRQTRYELLHDSTVTCVPWRHCLQP